MKGLKVAHEVDEFEEGETRILTLKDRGVLDDDGIYMWMFTRSGELMCFPEEPEELVDIELEERAKAALNVENKSRKRAYTAYDDESNQFEKKILAHYDEDFGKLGKRVGRFDYGLFVFLSQHLGIHSFRCRHSWKSPAPTAYGEFETDNRLIEFRENASHTGL